MASCIGSYGLVVKSLLKGVEPTASQLAILVVVGGIVASRLPLYSVSGALWATAGFLLLAGVLFETRLFALSLGAIWLFLAVEAQHAERWPVQRWNENVSGEFIVEDFPVVNDERLVMVVRPIGRPTLPRKIRVSWYRTTVHPLPGERWHLALRLRPPRGSANPGGFDYERWLASQGIAASAYVVRHPANSRVATTPAGSVADWRVRLRDAIAARLPEDQRRAIINALLLGDRSALNQATRSLFMRSGTAHLMAISGLHVSLLVALVLVVTNGVARLWLAGTGKPCSRWPGALIALGTACIYGLITGFGLPVQRACIMATVVLLAWASGRRLLSAHGLALAACVVFVLDPLCVYSSGFYLSFGAVLILLILAARARAARHSSSRWKRTVSWQWWLSISSVPLTLGTLGQVSMIGPLANLVLIPWFSFAVVPAIFLAAVAAAVIPEISLWSLAWHALGPALAVLKSLASLPFAWFAASSWGVAQLLMLALVAGLALLPVAKAVRVLLIVALLVRAWPAPDRPETDDCLTAHMLDVGQGLAVILQTRNHTLLYDTGPAFPGGFSAADAVIAPALNSLGVREPDLIMVSHADNDHAGGLSELTTRYPASAVLRSSQPANSAPGCVAGKQWRWDSYQFDILAPPVGTEVGRAGNAESCVLRISDRYGQGVVLLTGDIGVAEERALVATGVALDSRLVVVAHHGSKTSSAPEFVRAVRPDLAWVAAGFKNRWGFPHPDVQARWQAAGSAVLTSGNRGALRASWCGSKLEFDRGFREMKPGFTRLPPVISRP